MLDQISADHAFDCTMIVYHMDWPDPNDPFWLANTAENEDRRAFYAVNYVPHVYIDGLIDAEYTPDPWEQMMFDRRAVESPLTIVLSGEMTSETAGTLTATVTNTSAGAVTGVLQFVLIEDDIEYQGSTYGHVMRDFLDPGTGGEAIALNPGEVLERTHTFEIQTGWVRQSMEAIVFVQNTGTLEIYQTGRLFFDLDQPELRLIDQSVDETAGGDGDGRLDPGETANLVCRLQNLNPIDGNGVTGTLSTTDPYLTITDAAGSWPDIPFGGEAENAADPFVVTVANDPPGGHVARLELALTPAGGEVQTLPVELRIGSPELVTGPDDYGYYAYENGDLADPAPTYGWVEIDPNHGGSGTILNLNDNQMGHVTLPFTFRHYGNAFTPLSISSNGFIALGSVGDYTYNNGQMPGPEGPANTIAGFWTDLNPAAPGSGKVYTYNDAAHHRYVVEFSGVEHWNSGGLGLPETFEFILFDPVYYPTPTGDGEIVLQYQLVSDASDCTVGIENGTETIGIQYLAKGDLNASAGGLVTGRAIKYTTVVPSSASVDADGARPRGGLRAWPNPAGSGAQIAFDVPAAGRVTLRVYDVAGASVRTLFDGVLPAGPGSMAWDGRDDHGRDVQGGIYFYRLRGNGFESSRKIVRE